MSKIGIKDIADYVGVSTALVSYVISGQAIEKQVNKDTAQRILDAAEKLNYRPNQIARSLKISKTYTIGLVVADINYRFSTGITRAIEEEAKANNYTVIYGSSNEDNEKFEELVNVFINRRVDGLIIVPVEGSENVIRKLQQNDLPFVLVDRNFPDIPTNYIALDNYHAAFNATSYLVSAGHTKIAMLNYQTTLFHLLERNRGYQDALVSQGIDFKQNRLVEVKSNQNKTEMQLAISQVTEGEDACDAIFFATDTLAILGLQCLNHKNLKVPQDISVLSFDESDAFSLFYTPITHSRQPLEKMGELAVKTLVELINKKKVTRQINLEAELIIGKSCRE